MSARISETLNYRVLLLLVVLLNACAGGQQIDQRPTAGERTQELWAAPAHREKVDSLQVELAALNRQANLPEARQVAETAIMYSYQLADEYQVVRPAVLHNVLIRVGLKDRGLCYHWTEDLLNKLKALELRTFQLHWGVAHRGSELREHNSVVITASGQAFEHGMVLDPWRNSGDLYWSLVQADRYPWKERPSSEW